MTLSEARATAADAIRAAIPATEAVRVVEVDVVNESDLPELAAGLYDPSLATSSDKGPSVIAVMARGRTPEQAIELTAFTILTSRLALELLMPGRGRGLAVVDLVEDSLSRLPTDGLPRLLVTTVVAPLMERAVARDRQVSIFVSRCTWPSAFPAAPLASEQGGAMDAIRDHFARAVAAGLPSPAEPALMADDDEVGATEAARRVTQIDGTVPRAGILLDTRRETLGGEHDLAVIASQTITDGQDRQWEFRAASQEIVVTVEVRHRLETLADEAVTRIMGELDGSTVRWPGAFDAAVWDTTTQALVDQRITDGEFRQEVTLLNRTPAEWEVNRQGVSLGLHRAAFQATVQSVTQLQRATLSTTGAVMESSGTFRVRSTT